jgi:hypothetical protein
MPTDGAGQKNLKIAYPRAAIQTPFMTTASPSAANGQVVRNVRSALANMTVVPSSPIVDDLSLKRAASFRRT